MIDLNQCFPFLVSTLHPEDPITFTVTYNIISLISVLKYIKGFPSFPYTLDIHDIPSVLS
jgi:hypothetical protein